MSMKKCPRCGRLNAGSAKFCKYCGKSLKDVSTTTSSNSSDKSNTIICPNCGTQNLASSKFCIKCGHSLARSNKSNDKEKTQQDSDSIDSDSDSTPDFHLNESREDLHHEKNATSTKHHHLNDKKLTHSVRVHNRQGKLHRQELGQEFSGYSNNFFKWFSKSIAHPFTTFSTDMYFGLISFAAEFILMVLTLLAGDKSEMANNLLRTYFIPGFPTQNPGASDAINTDMGYLLSGLSFVGSILIIVIFLNFFFKHNKSILLGFTRVAAVTNINIFAMIILLVSTVIGSQFLMMLMLIIIIGVYGAGLSEYVDDNQDNCRLNPTYLSCGALCGWVIINNLIITVLTAIL